MTLSLIIILLFELFIILFNYKYQYVIIHAPLSSPQPNMLVAWVSSLELEFLNGYKAFSLLYTVSIIILPYRPPTQHTSYILLCQIITFCAANTPVDNCSVGLRSWCNTYCLQLYTTLFVFVFMAATLYSSFLKGFLVHGQKRNLVKIESSNIYKFRKPTPNNTGVHAYYINPYLHKFFQLILFN